MFRADRIKEVTSSEADSLRCLTISSRSRYQGAFVGKPETQTHVSMELAPQAMRWFEDYYPVVSSEVLPDGLAPSRGPDRWRDRWAATLILRLGDQVRAVTSPSVVAEARALASAIAARHAIGLWSHPGLRLNISP